MARTEHPCKIFVGNLPFSLDQNGFAKLFSRFGVIVGAKLVEDRSTGKKKGFGFITFESPDSVQMAIQTMHDQDCGGRSLTVKPATKRGEAATGDDCDEDADDDDDQPEESAAQQGDADVDGWGVASSRKKKGQSFKARADAKTKEGKLLGWGCKDDDWA